MTRRLPKRLHMKHGAYYYVARTGGRVKWTRLSTEFGEALRKWADIEGGRVTEDWTVAQAVGHYIDVSTKRLKPTTITGYEFSSKQLLAVFGNMRVSEVKKSQVYSYVVKRGNVAGNRERALLSATYGHLAKAGIYEGDNPAAGLQFRNKETARRRYITDAEFITLLRASTKEMRALLKLAYATGMRQTDILSLCVTAAREEGIWYIDSKTNTEHLIEWTFELRGIWQEAVGGRTEPSPVFRARGGAAYTTSGFRATFRALRKRAGLLSITFHDVRRKSGSDADDDAHAQHLLGHTDPKVTRKHYRAKVKSVRPIKSV